VLGLRKPFNDSLCELSRFDSELLGKLHGNICKEVPVLGPVGAVNLNVCRWIARKDLLRTQILERAFDEFPQMLLYRGHAGLLRWHHHFSPGIHYSSHRGSSDRL
jgi:hypothetical protein